MDRNEQPFYKVEEFAPGLGEALQDPPFDPDRMIYLAVPVRDPREWPLVPAKPDRGGLVPRSGDQTWFWRVESLEELFRGEKEPPVLGDYPEDYNEAFGLLDFHAIEISKMFGDRRDAEMLEIFAALRKRPDGRSLGFVHDYMWGAAALMLGLQPLSRAEFEAIMARLELSCRRFQQGPTSRNYIGKIRPLFSDLSAAPEA